MITRVRAEISVVVPSRNRPQSLTALIAALRAQTLSDDQFELIVVDDGSAPPLGVGRDSHMVRVLRHEHPRGPGAARNTGWRAAQAPVIAFIDDDCIPCPNWLGTVLAAYQDTPSTSVIVQGPVEPEPARRDQLGPLSHTVQVTGLDRLFACCNIAYSRPLLEQPEGLRRTAHALRRRRRPRHPGAQGRRRAGLRAVGRRLPRDPSTWVAALIRHTLKWTDSVRVLSMHPELRELLIAGVFWKRTHPRLLLALAGICSRRRLLAAGASLPYLGHYRTVYRGRWRQLMRALPVHVAIDATEVVTVLAGSLRYRTLML